MDEAERLVARIEAPLASNPIACKLLHALIAAVEERRDRRWLENVGFLIPPYECDGSTAGLIRSMICQIGYEPDGSGGWRRKEDE